MSENDWQDDPDIQRAAWEGIVGNTALPTADRLAAAQKVIAGLRDATAKTLRTLRALEVQHRAAGLFPAALAYLGAAELVQNDILGNDE